MEGNNNPQEDNIGTTDTDKSMLITILSFVLRVYKVAIKNYVDIKAGNKMREYLRKIIHVKQMIKHLTTKTETFSVEVTEDDTVYTYGKLSFLIYQDNVLAKWQDDNLYITIFDFDKIGDLLDEIQKDQTVLLNTVD